MIKASGAEQPEKTPDENSKIGKTFSANQCSQKSGIVKYSPLLLKLI